MFHRRALAAYWVAHANGYAPATFASMIWNRGSRFSDKIVFHRRSGHRIVPKRLTFSVVVFKAAALDRRRDEVEL
jgi:hypothetical protein